MHEFINRILARRKHHDSGATAVEYALILAAIVGIMAVLFFTIGKNVQGRLNTACGSIVESSTGKCV